VEVLHPSAAKINKVRAACLGGPCPFVVPSVHVFILLTCVT